MTKPITSVAAMMLYEEGAFELDDPVAGTCRPSPTPGSISGGSDLKPVTVPLTEPVRIWHLLTHTAGLTYGFHRAHPVDAMLPAAGYRVGLAGRDRPGRGGRAAGRNCRCSSSRAPSGTTPWPPTCSAGWSRWSPAASLDDFFQQRIFAPLGMTRHRLLGRARGRRPPRPALPAPTPTAMAPGDPLGGYALRRPTAAQRGRRPGLHGRGLPPVHPDAAARRRAGRRAAARPAHARPT